MGLFVLGKCCMFLETEKKAIYLTIRRSFRNSVAYSICEIILYRSPKAFVNDSNHDGRFIEVEILFGILLKVIKIL